MVSTSTNFSKVVNFFQDQDYTPVEANQLTTEFFAENFKNIKPEYIAELTKITSKIKKNRSQKIVENTVYTKARIIHGQIYFE